MLLALAILGCGDKPADSVDSTASKDPVSDAGHAAVAELPEYLSGEEVSHILSWPWIQGANLCEEVAISELVDLPRPGHGLTSVVEPTEELRQASVYLGLEWEDWEGRWFDRNSVMLYRRTAEVSESAEFNAASLYLIYLGDPPQWDEAQSSVLYACDEVGGDKGGRPLPPPIYVELDEEQVDVRYGAVLALLNPTHLPGIDLEAKCVEMSPGSVDHRYGRRTAIPHGLPQGTVTASELPKSLMIEGALSDSEHIWVTEFRVMAFTHTPRVKSRFTRLAEVSEFALIEDDGEERWIELARGLIWACDD